MGEAAVRVSRPIAIVAGPVMIVQGRQVRRTTPVLPEAVGSREGTEGGRASGAGLALLVLGESTAAGVGVGTQADGLGRQSAAALARRTGRAVRWRVVARTGTTVNGALTRLVPQLGHDDYDVIAVSLGVNDVLKLTSRARWEGAMAALAGSLQSRLRPGGRIVISGVPNLAAFPALPWPLRTVLGWHARNLDRALARVATGSPATVHMPLPRLARPGLWADDRFHPNAEGYREWATQIASTVEPAHSQERRG